jgi:hypothetical protein
LGNIPNILTAGEWLLRVKVEAAKTVLEAVIDGEGNFPDIQNIRIYVAKCMPDIITDQVFEDIDSPSPCNLERENMLGGIS